VNFYARNLDLQPEPRLDVARIGNYLRVQGLMKTTNLGYGNVSICDANMIVDHLMRILKATPTFFLKDDSSKN
jgi:aminoglycoside N3'-acetyltransferase